MQTNRSMPPGVFIPELAYDDVAAAVEWLCAAFGFAERLRIGEHRAQLVFGGASMIVTKLPDGAAAGAGAHAVMVRVADVDAHYTRAGAAGAQIVAPPADFPYGERQYVAEDLAGHRWVFSQPIADIDPANWGGVLRGE